MKYLASFVRKYLFKDFCLPELQALCQMFQVKLTIDKNFSYDLDIDPVLQLDIPDMENGIADKICNRAVLTRNIIKLYGQADTYEEIVANINKEELLSETSSKESYKFEVDARGRVLTYILIYNYSQEQKLDIIAIFLNGLEFKGKVNLKNPKRTFVIIDNHYKGRKYFGKLVASKPDGIIYILIYRGLSILFKI